MTQLDYLFNNRHIDRAVALFIQYVLLPPVKAAGYLLRKLAGE
jgi:hypothetical protein